MDWFLQQQAAAHSAQQRAHRRAVAAQQQAAADRVASLNYRPEQATANPNEIPSPRWAPSDPPGPMPEEVRHQLEITGGLVGQWLPTQFAAWRLEAWRQEWLGSGSPQSEVVAERERERERLRQVEEERQQRERERAADERRLRRERQEAYRLAVGTVVRITAVRMRLANRLGRIVAVRWGDELLMGGVLVDPLPPDHPLFAVEPRFRPVGYQPELHWLPMEQLRREHPEALA